MKAVVDTNVIAYLLLGTAKFVDEARAFWASAEELLAPALWEAELVNVIWMAACSGVIGPDDASVKLTLAGRLGIRSVNVRSLWQGALGRSLATGVTAYDTLYVELAARERVRLATFDTKILKAFPDIALRPGELT